MNIKDISKKDIGQTITLKGWVRSNRDSGKIGFISLYDGSSINELQIVYKGIKELSKLNTGAALCVEGEIVESRGQQDFELFVNKVVFTNNVSDDYPIQKKETSKEHLREIAHLRARTKFFSSVLKVRSELSFAIHKFYNQSGFYYFHSPIITSNDCEGAGEAFSVTTQKGEESFEKDFFKRKSILTVSGQLHAETAAQAVKKVYTFGPTFRSEHSHTSRHAAEFWMLEPEIAFAGIEEITKHGEELLKFCINYILKTCMPEIEYFQSINNDNLISQLKNIANSEFKYMKYSQIVEILQEAISQGVKFEDNNIHFGMDFGSEHERYISEKVVNGPVFATHYPAEIKAFYMKEASDSKLVESFDLLVPGIGELIGGSARENDYDKLVQKANHHNIEVKDLQWYFDLRRFGSAPSAGFGLGFERLIMYVTGVKNIRDTIPFPRTPDSIEW